MFTYSIVNHPESFVLDVSRIARVFELVSEVPLPPGKGGMSEGQGGLLSVQNGILNIAFLTDDEIQVLNRDHRGIDKTTDVLSFHYYDDFSGISRDEVAGEIILSESRIIAQALEHEHSPERECEILLIHSILHILGYDHETDEDYEAMWEWESQIRDK